jgi:hypothetical protein
MTDKAEVVAMMLAEAGMSPSDEEMAKLVEAYPLHKAGIESMYAVPETRYEVPGLIFTADPPFTDWAG